MKVIPEVCRVPKFVLKYMIKRLQQEEIYTV
jgi:hypothetical protein